MIKLILLPLFIICLFSCRQKSSLTTSQVANNNDSIQFEKKCKAFIKEIKPEYFSDQNFILSDKLFGFEYFDCMKNVLSDTTMYTKEELLILKQKSYPSLQNWHSKIFANMKLVSGDTINAIFKDRSRSWNYFYKHIGESFNTFSVPIFLRNDTYCLFYSDNYCGYLCGGGNLTLYKRQNNKWVVIKTYCEWIS